MANEAPVANNDFYSVIEDFQIVADMPGILFNDADAEGDQIIWFDVVNQPQHGSLTWFPDGSFTYTPDPDFASLDFFDYRVQDVVGGLPGQVSNTARVEIVVVAVEDPPTITSNDGGPTAAVLVAENTTAVTTVIATDPDAGDGVTYSISGGFDGNLFSIDSVSGALSFTSAPDFENPNPNGGLSDQLYDVQVRATDNSGAFDEQLITVTVTDVNESPQNSAPIDIELSANTVAENAANGTIIGLLSGTDPDFGDILNFTLTDEAGGRFAIANGTQLVVANGVALDFEAAASHNVTVRVTDTDGLTYDETFTIALQNVVGQTITGTGAANTLTGTNEEDTISGLGGADTLQGGAGNDTLNGGTGNDLLQGGAGNDALLGEAGNDTLDGGAGNDTMAGGTNNDTYDVDSTDDVVLENAGEGTDTIRTAFSVYSLASIANVENLTFNGVGNFTGAGNELANTLTGGAGNDTLDGAGGTDRLTGLGGDDSYHVDSATDDIVEVAGGGTDTVFATSSNFTLDANVENLVFTGAGNFNGTGNGLANQIAGGIGDDTLIGGGGDDTIVANAGNDSVSGGTGGDIFLATLDDGNDSYSGNGGTDTYSLSGTTADAIVNLALGTASSSRTGADTLSSIENVIGGDGNDTIIAGNGHNVLMGGAGSDTFVFVSTAAAGSGANRDRVTDFTDADLVDLGGIDANGGQAGDPPFMFVGEVANVVGGVGQLGRGELGYHFEMDANGIEHTIIEGNINANPAADFQIDLVGHHALSGFDFML